VSFVFLYIIIIIIAAVTFNVIRRTTDSVKQALLWSVLAFFAFPTLSYLLYVFVPISYELTLLLPFIIVPAGIYFLNSKLKHRAGAIAGGWASSSTDDDEWTDS